MTALELQLWIEGYQRREQMKSKAWDYRLAWHAANIMNVWTKRKVQPRQLLGGKTVSSMAEWREMQKKKQKEGEEQWR